MHYIQSILFILLMSISFYGAYFQYRKQQNRPLPKPRWVGVVMVVALAAALFVLGMTFDRR